MPRPGGGQTSGNAETSGVSPLTLGPAHLGQEQGGTAESHLLTNAGGTRRRKGQRTNGTEIARRTRCRGTRELRPSSPPNTPAGPQGRPRMATRTPGHQVRRMRFLGVRFPIPQEFNLGITTESAIPRLPRVVAVLGSASRATYAPRLLAKPGRSPPSPGCLCSPSV